MVLIPVVLSIGIPIVPILSLIPVIAFPIASLLVAVSVFP